MASRDPERLPRQVVVLGWVSFFADISGEMIYPLLPLFLVGVLQESATSLGWVEGVAQAVVAVLTAWAGWRSDRFRRRVPYVRVGYTLPVAGKALLAIAFAWPMVLVGRTIDRIGKGIRSSPRDALIADATAPAMRGRAFGLHRAMDTAGAFVGVLLAAVLLWWLTGSPTPGGAHVVGPEAAGAFRTVFAIAAGLGIIAAVLTFVLRDPAPPEPALEPATGDPVTPVVTARGLPRAYWIVVAMLLVFTIANSSDTFLLLRGADAGLSPWSVVLAYALYNLVYTVVSYPAGLLSDRLGRWKVIALGWSIYALVYVGFAVTNATGIWPLFAAYGLYMALTDGVGKALIADHAPPAQRGLAIGIYYMCVGGTTLVASVVAGLLWDRIGHAAPFWFGACAAGGALLALPFVVRLAQRSAPSSNARP